jgi:putative (di)nucleoside polyphosphate hydrolase
VYTLALNELANILFRRGHESRYLRQRVQHQRTLANNGKTHARTAG